MSINLRQGKMLQSGSIEMSPFARRRIFQLLAAVSLVAAFFALVLALPSPPPNLTPGAAEAGIGAIDEVINQREQLKESIASQCAAMAQDRFEPGASLNELVLVVTKEEDRQTCIDYRSHSAGLDDYDLLDWRVTEAYRRAVEAYDAEFPPKGESVGLIGLMSIPMIGLGIFFISEARRIEQSGIQGRRDSSWSPWRDREDWLEKAKPNGLGLRQVKDKDGGHHYERY